MAVRAFITGIGGPKLTAEEEGFLREAEPWGLILFKRNLETQAQITATIDNFRNAIGRNAPVLIDQEGGRVQRLGPPHWPAYPPGVAYGRQFERDPAAGRRSAWLGARLIANDLTALGIDVDCLPLADVPVAGSDPIIGDRAYGQNPQQVAVLARSRRATAGAT